MASNSQTYSFWILFEGDLEAQRTEVTFDLERDADLSDLTSYLVSKKQKLQQLDKSDLIFLYYNNSKSLLSGKEVGQGLSGDTTLKGVEQKLPANMKLKEVMTKTSYENPLIVRYTLSSNTIVAKVRFLGSLAKISLPHTTGSWHMLLTKVQEKHGRLKEDENQFYFIYKAEDSKKSKDTDVENEFEFNDLVRIIKPNNESHIILNLHIRIKGKKAYGEWTTKDMLKEILHDEYESIKAIPVLDIDKTFGTERVLSDEELRSFTTNLAEITSAFHQEIDTNEATARNFINPFMVKAVAKVVSKYPSTRLAVEEEFDGSRGYGRLDYVVYCHKLAILITEAKMTEMQKGITQTIVQLHTAAEKKRKREAPARTGPSVFYGIVSTAKQWQFIHWSNPHNASSAPILKISRSYYVDFQDLHGATDVVSIIIRILQSCAEAEAENQEDTELAGPMAQRVRRE